MRQVQHGRKPRGRGRKQHNPLSRIYDSSGPDTKIRGTAAHIAEKYQSLARDATSSGHRVIAENYLQHAEHYLRIVAVAQAAMQSSASVQTGGGHSNHNTNTGQGDQTQPSERRDGGDEDSGGAAQAQESGAQNHQDSQPSGRGRRGQRRRQPSFDTSASSGDAAADTDIPAPPAGNEPETPSTPAGTADKKSRPAKVKTAEDTSVNGAPAPAADPEPAAPRRRTRRKPKVADDAGTVDAV